MSNRVPLITDDRAAKSALHDARGGRYALTSCATPCPYVFALVLSLLAANAASARTIVLTDEDCEKIAFINAVAPRLSWAGYEVQAGIFISSQLYLYPNTAYLIRFPIERVPKGQRIVKAELSFTTGAQSPGEQRINMRRVSTEWGPGVCWQYRATRPKKLEWNQPGARGAGNDRAAKASAIIRSTEAGEKTINVTEDVELWYGGATANHGWIFTFEEQDNYITLLSPIWSTRGTWKLRITYEPE